MTRPLAPDDHFSNQRGTHEGTQAVTDDRQDKSILGRVAVIVGVLAATATIVGVAWTIFNRENTEVADYQKQVLATCEQVRGILTTEHPEVLILAPGEFRVRKDLLLAVMRNNVTQARIAFDGLNGKPVPAALIAQHDAAVEAQTGWATAMGQVIDTIETQLPDNARVSRLQELGVELGGSQATTTRLNSAMTALAGSNCQISGSTA